MLHDGCWRLAALASHLKQLRKVVRHDLISRVSRHRGVTASSDFSHRLMIELHPRFLPRHNDLQNIIVVSLQQPRVSCANPLLARGASRPA